MLKRVIHALGIMALMVVVLPQFGQQMTCASFTSLASSAAPQHAQSMPSDSNCNSEGAMMNLDGTCLSCGSVLLSSQLFLPKEVIWNGVARFGSLIRPNPSFHHWRPPS